MKINDQFFLLNILSYVTGTSTFESTMDEVLNVTIQTTIILRRTFLWYAGLALTTWMKCYYCV